MPGIGLVERLGADLELQSFHLLHQVILTAIYLHIEVANGVVELQVEHILQADNLGECLMDRLQQLNTRLGYGCSEDQYQH